MGLYRMTPPPSARMGALWTLGCVGEIGVVEYGAMGHMLYQSVLLERLGGAQKADIISTHIDEQDIATGRTRRLAAGLDALIENSHPKAVILLPSIIPAVIGIDLAAVSGELQGRHPGIQLLTLPLTRLAAHANQGVEQALLLMAEHFPKLQGEPVPLTYNLLGVCPDRYNFDADAKEVRRLLYGAFGARCLCGFSAGASVSGMQAMGAAQVNVVLRREALLAAQALKKRLGTPYICPNLYGLAGINAMLRDLAPFFEREPDAEFIREEQVQAESMRKAAKPLLSRYGMRAAKVSLGGPADVVKGLRAFLQDDLGIRIGLCWCDDPGQAEDGLPFIPEDELMEAMETDDSALLLADGEWTRRLDGHRPALQIAHPSPGRKLLYPYAPFVGIRGVINLLCQLTERL